MTTTLLPSSGREQILGKTEPRLWTPPLRELTPDTSYGFDVIEFSREILGLPLDPWEEWALIHLGELLPDGRPRFRTVLILVARQNGKTTLSKVLILYWMFVERVPLILATSTDRNYAKAVWNEICDQVLANKWLSREVTGRAIRRQIGEESITNIHGSTYRFAATNRRAGRSLTVHRLLLDELREHRDFSAWDAATNAMNAVSDAQVVAISNQGDADSIVLDSLRTPAIEYIENGEGDYRLGLLEWSAPPGAEPTDIDAIAQANPNLGRRLDPDALIAKARKAKSAGGVELAGFRTEVLCQRVHLLDPAIDPDYWDLCGTDEPRQLTEYRDHLALCLDVSIDGSHASLVAAAVVDGKVNIEPVAAWDGYGCTQALRKELPSWVHKVNPRVLGWFPNGPAAAIAADMRKGWTPPRVKIAEIKGEIAQVCMGFAEQVKSKEVVHTKDPMLNQHVKAAQKLYKGDAWVYVRKDTSPVDGAYAAAGATHLARLLPPAPPKLAVL